MQINAGKILFSPPFEREGSFQSTTKLWLAPIFSFLPCYPGLVFGHITYIKVFHDERSIQHMDFSFSKGDSGTFTIETLVSVKVTILSVLDKLDKMEI